MSGALCAAAVMGKYVQPGSPLTGVSVTFTGGTGPFNVSGANNFGTGSPGFVQSGYTGGYPPVTGSSSVVGGNGKLGLYDTGQGDGTLGWTGLAVGETVTFYISTSYTDAHGTTLSARDPAAANISLTRTS